jgi:hypothetical protein
VRVTVYVSGVPAIADGKSPISLFSLFKHEHKASVLNFTVQRNTEYDGLVKSKVRLYLNHSTLLGSSIGRTLSSCVWDLVDYLSTQSTASIPVGVGKEQIMFINLSGSFGTVLPVSQRLMGQLYSESNPASCCGNRLTHQVDVRRSFDYRFSANVSTTQCPNWWLWEHSLILTRRVSLRNV